MFHNALKFPAMLGRSRLKVIVILFVALFTLNPLSVWAIGEQATEAPGANVAAKPNAQEGGIPNLVTLRITNRATKVHVNFGSITVNPGDTVEVPGLVNAIIDRSNSPVFVRNRISWTTVGPGRIVSGWFRDKYLGPESLQCIEIYEKSSGAVDWRDISCPSAPGATTEEPTTQADKPAGGSNSSTNDDTNVDDTSTGDKKPHIPPTGTVRPQETDSPTTASGQENEPADKTDSPTTTSGQENEPADKTDSPTTTSGQENEPTDKTDSPTTTSGQENEPADDTVPPPEIDPLACTTGPDDGSQNISAPAVTQLPALISYDFTGQESKVLPGLSTEVGQKYNCEGTMTDDDKIGRLAVVSLLYNNGCWTDGRYNHNDYKVEQGQLAGSNGTQFEAYKVHPPAKKATEFLGSRHALYYQFPTQEDYTVYTFDGQSIKKVLDIDAAQIDPAGYTQLKAVTISENQAPLTYIFSPSKEPLTAYTELAPGIEGAQLSQTALGTLAKYRFTIEGTPFDTTLDYTAGPEEWQNIYGQTRRFFPVQVSGQVGVIWQDQVDQTIQITKLAPDLQSHQTVTLPNNRREKLAAATSDDGETLYYLTIQEGGRDQNTARTATLYKVDAQGRPLQVQNLDTSPNGLNITLFGDFVADMRYANCQIGVMLARRLHKGSDGLQHQSGSALVYQADTLALQINLGQTSGHSFENVLTTNQADQFVGIDLGDNYPRGVHLHKFDGDQIKNKVVYTFKTQHGTKSRSPAGRTYPSYSQISRSGVTYYQWSNDNQTYTELGGVIEGQDGYTVVFASETGPGGKALLNNRVGSKLNDPRNIGLVEVKPDFEAQDDFVLTQGIEETGGYYTFGGDWRTQTNKGIIWLTNYQDKMQENVSRLKAAKLSDGNILLVWEKWTAKAYVNTYAMKVTADGLKLTEPLELGPDVRLGRRDNPLVSGDTVYLVAGDKVAQELMVIVLQP